MFVIIDILYNVSILMNVKYYVNMKKFMVLSLIWIKRYYIILNKNKYLEILSRCVIILCIMWIWIDIRYYVILCLYIMILNRM